MSMYEQIVDRFKKQNINLDGKHLLINNEFDGKRVRPAFSKDKSVVCLPALDYELSDCYGEDVYSPRCFFVDSIYNTWIQYNSMSINIDIYVLCD